MNEHTPAILIASLIDRLRVVLPVYPPGKICHADFTEDAEATTSSKDDLNYKAIQNLMAVGKLFRVHPKLIGLQNQRVALSCK
jgi:hypothetical protein